VAPGGEVYVADTWNHRIVKFDSEGGLLRHWGGMADTRGAVDQRPGLFWGPRELAIGPDGLLYVSDTGNKRIQVFDTDGKFVRTFGGEGSEPGKLREPVGLAFQENTLLVADTWNGRVQKLDLHGRPLAEFPVPGWEGQSLSNKPYLKADASGRILASAPDNGAVLIVGSNGGLAGSLQPEGPGGTGTALPTGLAEGPNGVLYVADSRGGVIHRLPSPR
jgi:sugar lactone lactonase YvrE